MKAKLKARSQAEHTQMLCIQHPFSCMMTSYVLWTGFLCMLNHIKKCWKPCAVPNPKAKFAIQYLYLLPNLYLIKSRFLYQSVTARCLWSPEEKMVFRKTWRCWTSGSLKRMGSDSGIRAGQTLFLAYQGCEACTWRQSYHQRTSRERSSPFIVCRTGRLKRPRLLEYFSGRLLEASRVFKA